MLTESLGRAATENHSGRDKQVPVVKDCRFTQTAFGTVVHDSSGKWLGQYETEDAAVEMLREMANDDGGSAYENDKVDIKSSVITELSEILDTDPNYLLGVEQDLYIIEMTELLKNLDNEVVREILMKQVKALI